MLIGSYNVFNKGPGRSLGGGLEAGSPGAWFKSGPRRNAYLSSTATYSKLSSIANTYMAPPYTWVLAFTPGGIGSRYEIEGTGTLTAAGAMGVNGEATIAGTSDLTATGELVVSGAAALAGTSTMTGDILAALAAEASIAGTSAVSATLDALGFIEATAAGIAAITATLNATGSLAAEISTVTPLSPEGLASSLWGSIAADYNVAGTMGEKLNSAGTAGDPWGADLSGYAAGTAGNQLNSKVLTLSKYVGLK